MSHAKQLLIESHNNLNLLQSLLNAYHSNEVPFSDSYVEHLKSHVKETRKAVNGYDVDILLTALRKNLSILQGLLTHYNSGQSRFSSSYGSYLQERVCETSNVICHF